PKSDSDGRYQLQGEIARGGMGAIIKGRDTDLGRDLAIKVLLDSHKDKPEVIQRFIEEAQIGGQLQHPGIAPVYELGQFEDKRPFFSMKLVKGQTFSKLLKEREDIAAERARFLGIFEQVCQTMAYAHSRGVIHRDLKPANIMIDGQGQVRITDFGLATFTGDGENIIGMSGTPAYMAPEQLLRGLTSVQSDIYSLGLVLFEVFTGNYAHKAQTLAELRQLHAHSSSVEMPSTMNVEMEPAVER
ncbi:MAG: serine/threonine protein kinase, partial [Planctomycetaceae bacterium]|nr:serine/threonine protein kinase [Planctomycetaceae bacterium]